MKIIGVASTGYTPTYIVEISEEEVALACGCPRGNYGDEWKALTKPIRERDSDRLKIGATVLVRAIHEHTGSLLRREEELKKTASLMRGFADALELVFKGTMVAHPEAPEEKAAI
jgi:hypothetical protein